MKLKQLIKILNKTLKYRGNIDVYILDPDELNNGNIVETEIYVAEKHDKVTEKVDCISLIDKETTERLWVK